MSDIQRTLVVLKPDTIGRSIVGEIISRFERAGLHVVAMKMVKPTKEFLYHHYENIGKMISRRGQKTFDMTLDMMTKLPVIAMVLEGVESVEFVRKIVGATEPKSAPAGTIRGDYAHMSFSYADGKSIGVPNLVHASGDLEEAKQEIPHWFNDNEIYSYDPLHSLFTR
ncbi:nucleoside-diphosphate kinase [Candidatus Gracilibacteria bacterium]|nr:nucleoside-diphosphate kinase [Candidatus Gracilibacteria bacterium]